jgi:hypothetical protein
MVAYEITTACATPQMMSPGHGAAGSGQYSRTKTTFSAAFAYQVTKASFARNNSTLVI